MKIAVLFDGAGLARLGLEQAGHECVGVELDPSKHHLSKLVGSGNCVLADALEFDLTGFDAVWASPPCQWRAAGRTEGLPQSEFAGWGVDLLDWSLNIQSGILWVENVTTMISSLNSWGKIWNAAQFLEQPLQNRNRVIGGRYLDPRVFHSYKKIFQGICPTVTATEWKGCATDGRRASRWYGRKLTPRESAYHQGFDIPEGWWDTPFGFTVAQWKRNIYEAIGNGVPVYMARAFGEAYGR